MKISYCKNLMNPELPTYMEGYQTRISYSQYDDLECHTLYIENDDPVIYHVLDLIMVEDSLVLELKNELHKLFSLDTDHISISAIHTHSGPLCSSFVDEGVPSQELMNKVKETIIKNTEYCLSHTKEAKVYFASKEVKDIYGNRNNKSLPFNPSLYMLRFDDLNDHPIVTLINGKCHPTVLGMSNYSISSDYVGVLRRSYQNATGCPAMFINGECGDISTRLYRQGIDYDEVKRVGNGIAEQLLDDCEFNEIDLDYFDVHHLEFVVDYNPQEDEFLLNAKKKLDSLDMEHPIKGDHYYTFHDMFTRNINQLLSQTHIHHTMNCYVYESKDIRIITIPGEIVTILGERLRHIDDKKTFVFAYTNGYHIYAVDKEEYGQYFESFNTHYPYGKADEMIDQIIQLIK